MAESEASAAGRSFLACAGCSAEMQPRLRDRRPYRRHAEHGVREHVDEDFAVWTHVFDRFQPLALRQAEEWPLHRLALIAQRQIRDIWDEQVELLVGCAERDRGEAFLHEAVFILC